MITPFISCFHLFLLFSTLRKTVAKLECPAGSYEESGSCTLCAPHTYNPMRGQEGVESCQPCAVGTGAPNKGSVVCEAVPKLECPAGAYLSLGHCRMCPPGRFNRLSGQIDEDSCKVCGEGTYAASDGSENCDKCPSGYSTDGLKGAEKCSLCRRGYFAPVGASTCEPCAPGSFSPNPSSDCFPCAPGTYNALEGQSKCLPCSEGSRQSVPGSTACDVC